MFCRIMRLRISELFHLELYADIKFRYKLSESINRLNSLCVFNLLDSVNFLGNDGKHIKLISLSQFTTLARMFKKRNLTRH